MESRRFVYVPFGAHGTARVENWRPLGRVDFTVQFHPPRVFLGLSFSCSCSFFLSSFLPFFLSSFLPFFLSSFLPSCRSHFGSSHFGSRPSSVKLFAYAASAELCLISQVVMVQQRSWKLYDDWKEVAHSKSSYRNQEKSSNKSSYGWKWKSWTACQFEGCPRWVYDHQGRSFCPQCIRPLPEPVPAKSPCVEPMCSPCGEEFGSNIPDGDPVALLLATADKIGWLGRDSLAAFLQSAQGKSKAKAPTPEHELAQKESEYNKASANERLLEKKLQKIDGGRREVAEATPSRTGYPWKTCACAITCLSRRSVGSMNRQRGQEQNRTRATQPFSNVSTG